MVSLDPIAADLASRWSFEPLEELPGGHCSRVYADGKHVLKVPFQGEEAESGWRAAIALSKADIGPKVFESDPAAGALLMERICPGTKLQEAALSEDQCRRIVLNFARQIQTLDPLGLMPVAQFVNPDLPLAQVLLKSSPAGVFLHGDLHHENILLGPRGWVVIDPKGLVGDPAFEPSAFIRNPIPGLADVPDLKQLLVTRIQTIAEESGFDPFRIWGWAMVALGTGPHDGPWMAVSQALDSFEGTWG